MIIVKLWGGMCNQMFQYAFGYALSHKHNDELFFDVDFYNNQPCHVGKRKILSHDDFSLTKMNFTPRPLIVKPFEGKYISHLIRYNTGCVLPLPKLRFTMEKLHKYYENVPYKEGVTNYYDGYWQTARYFRGFENEIKQEFTPKEAVIKKVNSWRSGINSFNCVAIHIRRGDYLNTVNQTTLHGGNVIGDEAYYLRAMEYVSGQLQHPTFCFFSDDIEWCKTTFGVKQNYIYVENKGSDAALLDLFSISQCEHGIMSPSSFSWWGNWLRTDNSNSIVIGPKGEHSNEFFIDGTWIKI